MTFDKVKVSSYFNRAVSLKEEISPTLNEVLRYTDVSYQILDERRSTPVFRDIEPVTTNSITSLVNFIMSQLFTRGGTWASLEVNETLFKGQSGDTSDIANETDIRRINEQLEKNTATVFQYINSSNYYTEIAKAVRDVIVLGTGCYVIREQNSISKPFTYEYRSLDNLLFLEDAYGRPRYVFNMIYDVDKTTLLDRFGQSNITIPDRLNNSENSTVDILECVIPEYIEQTGTTVYNYYVVTNDYNTVIVEKTLRYNPFVLFRWNLESGLQYGIGLGIKGLKTFKDLEEFKKIRKEQALKIVNPPLKATGDKSLIHNITLEPGFINYGGTGGSSNIGSVINDFSLEPVITTQSLMPIDQDILKAEADIRDIFLSNPLGNNTDYKGRTATETQARMELFRQRWSGSFELLQQELLEPTLINPFVIMVEKNLITFDIENFDFTNTIYINELSRYSEIEKVERVNQFITTSYNSSQVCEAVGIKKDELIEYYADCFRVPLDIRFSPEELQGLAEQQRQYAMQLMAQQQIEQQQQAIQQGVVNE